MKVDRLLRLTAVSLAVSSTVCMLSFLVCTLLRSTDKTANLESLFSGSISQWTATTMGFGLPYVAMLWFVGVRFADRVGTAAAISVAIAGFLLSGILLAVGLTELSTWGGGYFSFFVMLPSLVVFFFAISALALLIGAMVRVLRQRLSQQQGNPGKPEQ